MTLRFDRKYHHRRATNPTWEFALGIPSFHFEEVDDPKLIWRLMVGALVFHVAMLFAPAPSFTRDVRNLPQGRRVMVLQNVRFRAPEQQPEATLPRPQKKARKVPMPDVTPDLPEPVIDETYDAPPLMFNDAIGDISYVPEAPPGLGLPQAVEMSGDILPPKKIDGRQPGYTEEARAARIQGIVILQAIIDEEGRVTHARVVKGLPMGLSESAIETVKTWTYSPAISEGEPIAVYYNFTINFSLQ